MSIDDFVKGNGLARVRIAGGGSTQFYYAELRSFAHEGDSVAEVVVNAFGLRSMLADAQAREIKGTDTNGNGTKYGRFFDPTLLRINARPRDFPDTNEPGASRSLHLRVGSAVVEAPIGQKDAASDLLVTPTGKWPDHPDEFAHVPPFKLVEGRYQIEIELTNAGNTPNTLGKFLSFTGNTLFGGLGITVIGTKPKRLGAVLVPQGIEFEATLLDPTRLGNAGASISAVFRLECGPEQNYFLRLVRARDGAEQPAIDALEGRIAAAFAELGPAGAPLAVRYDKRPLAPPLTWPLDVVSKALRLREAAGASKDFEMQIDKGAIDLRVKTQGQLRDVEQGMATVFPEAVTWVRETETTFSVALVAGKNIAGVGLRARFERSDQPGLWPGKVEHFSAGNELKAPLRPIADRLLPLYRAARAMDQTFDHAPYLFIPVENGLLQVALPDIDQGTTSPDLPNPRPPASAMSGRIYLGQGGTSTRGLVLDDAEGIELTIGWKDGKAASVTLSARTPKGRLLGFLFVCESSPTGLEAVPNLQGGPAATRDLPLWFESTPAQPFLQGKGSWDAATGKFTFTAKTDALTVPDSAGVNPKAIAWLPPSDSPLVTNHPLTRGLSAAPEPSVSRGLLPRVVGGEINLVFLDDKRYLPAFASVKQSWWRAEGGQEGVGFRDDTLVSTTLAGAEFFARPFGADGKFGLDATLRFDLPILDELFAWSDPPKKTQGASQLGPKELVEPPSLPTALQPDRLEKVWQANRRRMVLTRTQSAHLVDWLAEGAQHQVKIAGLVETYGWSTSAEVHAVDKAGDAYGKYMLDGKPYRLDAAVYGLGGDPDAGPVSFRINGDALVTTGQRPIVVAGYAASLYKHQDMRWDSRGFGMAAQASDGVRTARLRTWEAKDKIKPLDFALTTMRGPQALGIPKASEAWSFAPSLTFFARDLPVEGTEFHGESNPVESAFGANGRAFDQADFARSLHEWRLFEEPRQGVRAHHIKWGPFAFRPLRLIGAKFDQTEVTSINVVGSMRLGKEPRKSEEPREDDGPFGPDDIYRHGNLVRLLLTKKDSGGWGYSWIGVKAERRDDGTFAFIDQPQAMVSFESLLSHGVEPESYRFSEPVLARIGIDIARPADALTAVIELRLFGTDLTLSPGIEPTADGLKATVESGSTVVAKTGVTFNPKLVFEVGHTRGSLTVTGAISVWPTDKASKALVEIRPTSLAWLDLSMKSAASIRIDHRTGLIHGKLSVGLAAGASPLFGLAARRPLDVLASFAVVCDGANVAKDGKLDVIAMRTAWLRVAASDGTGNRVDHRLRASAAAKGHTIELTWSRSETSPIRWPAGQMKDEKGHDLPAEWLDPKESQHAAKDRSRIISITDDKNARLRHQVTIHFNKHSISADGLVCAVEAMPVERRVTTPGAGAVRLLCVVDHQLFDTKDNARAGWMTLDHLAITTPSLMAAEAQAYSFAPRSLNHKYRAETIKSGHAGIIQLAHGAAGFHDRLLAGKLWDKSRRTILVGGSAALFILSGKQAGGAAAADDPTFPQKAFAAVVPWLIMPGAEPINVAAGVWRVAAPDLWPATALETSANLATVVIGRELSGAEIVQQFGEGRFVKLATDAAEVELTMPVEQAYFEKWKAGAAVKMEDDYAAAPFFLRAMMAIEARLKADAGALPKGGLDWRAESILAARLTNANGGKPAAAALRCRVGTAKRDKSTTAILPTAEQSANPMRSASITGLSADRIVANPDYRRVPPQTTEIARKEALEVAADLDRDALIAIVEIDGGEENPSIEPYVVPARLDPDAEIGGDLTSEGASLSPSAALGWPSDTATSDLHKMAPGLGDELPVLGHEAGFAARFQVFGWPAYAAAADGPKGGRFTEALYVSFGNHVAYDRGTTKFLPDGTPSTATRPIDFDGPTARHLLPAVVRRRAPNTDAVNAVLASLERPPAGDKDGQSDKTAGPKSAPILPAAIERATVGRRPGVLEAVIASVTVPGDREPFDPEHARFGRPANSAPVAAHQLRNPRSPVLPRDEFSPKQLKDDLPGFETLTLGYRRRTYVSLADVDFATGRLPTLDLFEESSDVVRFQTGARHDKAVFRFDKQEAFVGPDWGGKLGVELKVTSYNAGAGPSPDVTTTGKLQVGDENFKLQFLVAGKFEDTQTFAMATDGFSMQVERLADARAALAEATADTPIRIVLELERPASAAKVENGLALGPRGQVVLPLLLDPGVRRVVPVMARTIVFGDPAYDRQLASQTMSEQRESETLKKGFLVSADRHEYDLGETLYLAGGVVDQTLGTFRADPGIPFYRIELFRLPPQADDGTQLPPERLVAGTALQQAQGHLVASNSVVELPLRQLTRRPVDDSALPPNPTAALAPGDRLQIRLTPMASKQEGSEIADKAFLEFTLAVDIVAEPVIAPPPAVYSVIETTADRKVARVRLHAAGPLPQKIEFPDLLRDLALQHVRRRALFVWRYSAAGRLGDPADLSTDLIKFDRSGGAQLPK